MKAACFSAAVMDYFETGNCSMPGGNALNQAAHFAKLGWESTLIAAVGKDPAGSRIETCLKVAGVDTSRLYHRRGATASNRLFNDKDGERHAVAGAWKGGVYDGFHLSREDWAFLDSCDLVVTHADCPDYPAFLHNISPECFVAVDFLHLEDYVLMRESTEVADILFSGGHMGMVGQLRDLARLGKALVVLTLGPSGSLAFSGEDVYRQGALPAGRIIDTTGCGDAFQAAFTHSFINHRDIAKALLQGATAGAAATAYYGSIDW